MAKNNCKESEKALIAAIKELTSASEEYGKIGNKHSEKTDEVADRYRKAWKIYTKKSQDFSDCLEIFKKIKIVE
jgi:hypothetical protein